MSAPLTPFLGVRETASRLTGSAVDRDPLLEMAKGKRYVLLDEATHGTREFYQTRADIIRQLIVQGGFDAVTIEGGWPDVWRIDRYVQGEGADTVTEALGDSQRFPEWMWRNPEVLNFITWLHEHNTALATSERVGVCGLDLYSLYRSVEAITEYLQKTDPEQVAVARMYYATLDHVREPMTYGYEAVTGLRLPAQREVVKQLRWLRVSEARLIEQDGIAAIDSHFFAEQNAIVVVNAEAYYRESFGHRVNTWNLRDMHMAQTLLGLAAYRQHRSGDGRVVVWAHNSYVGGIRATESTSRHEWNLGQLVHEQVGGAALLVGFTTYTGHVCVASEWGSEAERKWVRPTRPDSWEHVFHSTRPDRFLLPLGDTMADVFHEPPLERAIGVLYLPKTEYASHYFDAAIGAQFDALIHLDEVSAIEPLTAALLP